MSPLQLHSCLIRYGVVKSAVIYVPEMLHQKYALYAKLARTGLNVSCSRMTFNSFPNEWSAYFLRHSSESYLTNRSNNYYDIKKSNELSAG